jgi:hypothetical protein
LQEKDNTP